MNFEHPLMSPMYFPLRAGAHKQVQSLTHVRLSHTDSSSYIFFQRGELLIESDRICAQWEGSSSSVLNVIWEIAGISGFCYQLFSGIDDFQDFCRYVAERDSRVLLFCYKNRQRKQQH